MEWTTLTSLGVRGGVTAFSQRYLIKKYWKKLLAKMDVGATDIVVVGHAGAGKSVLVSQMHGQARDWYYEQPGESLNVEVEAVTIGDWSKLIRVLPGQSARRTLGEVRVFGDKNLEGVIYVVDFGYVVPRDTVQVQKLLDEGIDTIDDLRAYNMRAEVHGLVGLLASLRQMHEKFRTPKWVVIAVNKVDLYKSDKAEALRFYHPDGGKEFGNILKEFQSHVGVSSLGVYVVPCCANVRKIEWNGVVQKSGLEENEQFDILKNFVMTIAKISEKHS